MDLRSFSSMEYDMLAAPDYAVIAGVLAVFSSVGIYFRFTGGRQKTTQEFLRADGEIGVKTIIVSSLANLVTPLAFITITADMYLYGTQFWVSALGFFVGAVITAYTMLPVFHNLKTFIVYEYLESRFGKGTKMTVTVLYILQTLTYISVSSYGPAQALNVVTGLSIWTSVLTLTCVCIFYSLMGGLKAVLWTNILQGFILLFCVISVFVKGTVETGGIDQVVQIANERGQIVLANFSLSLTERFTFWNSFFQGMFFGIYNFGCNQIQVQRLLSVKTLKKVKIASVCCAFLGFIGYMLCFSLATVMYSLMHDCDPLLRKILSSRDQLVPYTIMVLFNGYPVLRGLCISGVFSSMLSIISSSLNSLAGVTLKDFITPYCIGRRLAGTWVAKMLVLAYGCVNVFMVYVLSLFPGIFEAFGVFCGVTVAPIIGVFFLGLFTSVANQKGALFGVAVNIAVISWIGFGRMTTKSVHTTLPRSVDGCHTINTESSNILMENVTDFIRFEIHNTSEFAMHHQKNVFPLYRVSFLWLLFFGVVICFTVGYISSYLTECLSKSDKKVDRALVSPIVRSCYFESKDESSTDKVKKENIADIRSQFTSIISNGDMMTKL